MPETLSPTPTLYRTSPLVAVTSAASPNTKGVYTEVLASTEFAATGVYVYVTKGSQLGDQLIDIAIGAAGSEVVIVSNILISSLATNHNSLPVLYFPVSIPRGTRIAARAQGTVAAAAVSVAVTLLTGGSEQEQSAGLVTTYGVNTADSGGQSVDPGAVISTKGAYVQLTAATSHRTRSLLVGIGGQANTARVAASFSLDIATGAAASEQVLLPDLQVRSVLLMVPPVLGPFPVDIPAGTRLSARALSTITDATDRIFDVVLYAVS